MRLSSYGLLLRFGVCIRFTLILSSMYFVYIVVLIVAVVIVLINFQPYKTSASYYTDIDASYLILFSIYFTMINGNNIFSIKSQVFFTSIFYGLATLSGIIPIIYVIALHSMYSRWIFGKKYVDENMQYYT